MTNRISNRFPSMPPSDGNFIKVLSHIRRVNLPEMSPEETVSFVNGLVNNALNDASGYINDTISDLDTTFDSQISREAQGTNMSVTDYLDDRLEEIADLYAGIRTNTLSIQDSTAEDHLERERNIAFGSLSIALTNLSDAIGMPATITLFQQIRSAIDTRLAQTPGVEEQVLLPAPPTGHTKWALPSQITLPPDYQNDTARVASDIEDMARESFSAITDGRILRHITLTQEQVPAAQQNMTPKEYLERSISILSAAYIHLRMGQPMLLDTDEQDLTPILISNVLTSLSETVGSNITEQIYRGVSDAAEEILEQRFGTGPQK